MLDLVADEYRENIHEYLADDKKRGAEQDVSQRPAVIQRVHHKNDLGNDVDNEGCAINDKIKRPQYSLLLV